MQDFRSYSKWRNFAPPSTDGWKFLVQSTEGNKVLGRFGATTEVKAVGMNFIIKY